MTRTSAKSKPLFFFFFFSSPLQQIILDLLQDVDLDTNASEDEDASSRRTIKGKLAWRRPVFSSPIKRKHSCDDDELNTFNWHMKECV